VKPRGMLLLLDLALPVVCEDLADRAAEVAGCGFGFADASPAANTAATKPMATWERDMAAPTIAARA